MQNDFLLIRKMKQGDDDALDLLSTNIIKTFLTIVIIIALIKRMQKIWHRKPLYIFSQNYLIIIIGEKP